MLLQLADQHRKDGHDLRGQLGASGLAVEGIRIDQNPFKVKHRTRYDYRSYLKSKVSAFDLGELFCA